ncbi:MAG: extracellular solute-binding protein [Culicoidibacterales bacterium]
MKKIQNIVLSLIVIVVLSGCTTSSDHLNHKLLRVYTTRRHVVDNVINDNFTQKTGIEIELVEIKDEEIVHRLSVEQDRTSADVVMFNGAEKIAGLKRGNLLQNHQLENNIGSYLDSQFYGSDWISVMKVPRGIVTLKENTQPPTEYLNIAEENYKGKLFATLNQSDTNIAFLSAMYTNDAVQAEKMIEGITKNIDQKSDDPDSEQIKNLVARNDSKSVAFVDTPCIELMKRSRNAVEKQAYEKIKVVYPNETFTNISAMGISTYSKKKNEANQYMEYLLSREVQAEYMANLGEYPVRNDVPLIESLAEFPKLSDMKVDYEKIGNNKEQVKEILKKNEWDRF